MKKPNIFKPIINHKLCNNKRVYYSYLDSSFDDMLDTTSDVDATLNRLLNSGSYIFSKVVEIKTKEKNYRTKIAGKLKDKIVTIDKEVIPINEIVEIKEIK